MALLRSGTILYFNPFSAIFPLGHVFEIDRADMPAVAQNAKRTFLKFGAIDMLVGMFWIASVNLADNPAYDLARIVAVLCAWALATYILIGSINYKTTRIARARMHADASACRQPIAMLLPLVGFLSVFILSFPLISFRVPQLLPLSLALTALAAAAFIVAVLDHAVWWLRSAKRPW